MKNSLHRSLRQLLFLLLSFILIQSSYAYLLGMLKDGLSGENSLTIALGSVGGTGPKTAKNKAGKNLTTKHTTNDPVRFNIKANKVQASIGEEVELTITASLINVSPNLMFFLPGSNAYTLKMLLPAGFQQTGGTLTEFVTGELAYPSKAEATYTLKGFFTTVAPNTCFRLLRSDGQANSQSLFVEKANFCLPVSSVDKLGSARTATTTSLNWCVEAENGSGNRGVESNSQASGGQSIGGFGNSGEYMNYTITGVPTAGSYTLHLWYTSGEIPQFGIVVNNGVLQTVSGNSNSSWSGPFVEKIATISLQAGSNNLRIQGAGGSFGLDRLCVDGGTTSCTPPSLSLGTPACNGSSTYSVGFTTQSGASVSSSAGSVQGSQVVNVPVGTNLTVTASLNGCSFQQTANSPICNSGSSTNILTKVRFFFRNDGCATCQDRCAQSQVQGSTDNLNWTTLATIPSVSDGWNEVAVTNPTAWRYVRYQSAGGCYGELVELEFYNGATKLSGTPFGSEGNVSGLVYLNVFDSNLGTFWHGASPGTHNFAGLDMGVSAGGAGNLVSGNCYLIKSYQTSSGYSTLQAIGNQALLRSVNGQIDQIWKAESVGSQYKFTSQASNRDQVLYVEGLSDGQPLKLGAYVNNERYQWSLAASSQGGYRVYGGSSQNTWDQQGAGFNDVLHLYGSNANSSDFHWDKPYRRFSFSSVGCPTTSCTPPSLSLGTPACSGNTTYSVGFSAQAGASVTTSTGNVQGSQIVNIPVGTNVTVTASLGDCSAQQVANSPTCSTTPPIPSDFLTYTDQGWNDSDLRTLENNTIKVQFRKSIGGVVWWMGLKSNNRNLIQTHQNGNNWDCGRSYGAAWYASPTANTPFTIDGQTTYGIGFDPVWGGSITAGDGSQVIKSAFVQDAIRGTVFCEQVRPKQWDFYNKPASFLLNHEFWLAANNTLGHRMQVIVEPRPAGTDGPTTWTSFSQEEPGIYMIASLHKRIVRVNGVDIDKYPIELSGSPQTYYTDDYAIGTYNDDLSQGLTVYTPENNAMGSGQPAAIFGNVGEATDQSCGYMQSKNSRNLDSPGSYQETIYTIVGSRSDAISRIAQLPQPSQAFDFDFTNTSSLQHGWSNGEVMKVENGAWTHYIGAPHVDNNVTSHIGKIVSPSRRWNATDISTIELTAAVTAGCSELRLGWTKVDSNGNLQGYSKSFPVTGDGVERSYMISTSDLNWNGIINNISIEASPTISNSTKLILKRIRKF